MASNPSSMISIIRILAAAEPFVFILYPVDLRYSGAASPNSSSMLTHSLPSECTRGAAIDHSESSSSTNLRAKT